MRGQKLSDDNAATGRVRILWLIKGFGPGGAERLIASAAQVRDRDRFDYEAAYLLPWKDHLVGLLEDAGVPVTCLDVHDERDLRWAGRLRRLLRDGNYDIVHLHSPYVAGLTRLVARTLPRHRRPVLVSTEHNTWSSFALPTRLLNAWTARLDGARFAVSDNVRASMAPGLEADVEVIVHGVPVDEVRAAKAQREGMRRSLGIDPEVVLVGTVGNYRRQKAYPDLLEAARQVIDTGVPVSFVAVGQGPLEAEIKAVHRRLGLGQRFQLLGYRPDAVAVLSACDLFSLASHHEGLSVALMEAQVLGLPTVATDIGGITDAVTHGEHGYLVPPGRPDLLAQRIVELAGDPERRASMSEAAARSGERFDIRHAMRRIETVYWQLVESSGPRSPDRQA